MEIKISIKQKTPFLLSRTKPRRLSIIWFTLDQFTTLNRDEKESKIREFEIFSDSLSPEIATPLTRLLLEETRSRIIDILQNAELDDSEVEEYLMSNDKAIRRVHDMNVETARKMLFFVADLKRVRDFFYMVGVHVGMPRKEVLLHDLWKLDVEHFEVHSCYGGDKELEPKIGGFSWQSLRSTFNFYDILF